MVNCNEMMKVRISRRLEAAMASLVFRFKRDGIATSYVDRLVVELVADSSTFASLITGLMFGDEAKTSVCERISELVSAVSATEHDEPDRMFKQLCSVLATKVESDTLSSAHILCWALRDGGSATAKAFRERGVIAEEVVDVMCQLASGQYGEKTHAE